MSQLQSCHRVLWLLDYGGRTLNPGDVQREDPRRLPQIGRASCRERVS